MLSSIRAFVWRVIHLARRSGSGSPFEKELEFHLEMEIEENLRRGMSREEARRQALISLGGLDQTREACRETRAIRWLDESLNNLRYSLRSLRHTPVFTGAAVITLALGIGALTSVFSLFNSALLRPLPYEGQNRLLSIRYSGLPYSPFPGGETVIHSPSPISMSYSQYRAVRERNSAFADVSLYQIRQAEIRTGEPREKFNLAAVTANMFQALRTQPLRGRVFTAEEDRPGGPCLAVIKASFWRNMLGGQEDILGKQIVINGTFYTVIGILPASYNIPSNDIEVWTPLLVDNGNVIGTNRPMGALMATLKPGVNLLQAEENLRSIIGNLNKDYKTFFRASPLEPPTLMYYRDYLIGNYRPAFPILLIAGAFVMAIACANVANLFLIQAERRRRERALRVVLGAGKGRLLGQSLTEALLISGAGSALGIALAWWSLEYMRLLARQVIPRLNEAAIGLEGVGFAVAISVAASVVVGAVPAMKSDALLVNDLNATPTVSSQSRSRVRGFLVILEFALALVLSFGAGLMIRSLHNLLNVGLGFNPDHVLTFSLNLSRSQYPTGRAVEFYDRLEQRLANLPGVRAAGMTNYLPLANSVISNEIRSEQMATRPSVATVRYVVSPGYFNAMGIPILRGRCFSELDLSQKEQVVIIDENLARKFWPNEEALGKRLFVDPTQAGVPMNSEQSPPPEAIPLTVVGVAQSVRKYGFRTSAPRREDEEIGEYYRPSGAFDGAVNLVFVGTSFAVRTQSDPTKLIDAVRREVMALDKNLTPTQFTTMENRWLDFSAETRFYTIILNAFGLSALLLAAVGIYGIVAYSISQRTHEFGVRMALGAEAHQIFRLVAGEGMRWVVVGVAVGSFGALALSRYLSSMLFEVSSSDALTFGTSVLLLAGVAFFACYKPARRATKLDPWTVLRID